MEESLEILTFQLYKSWIIPNAKLFNIHPMVLVEIVYNVWLNEYSLIM